MDIGTIVGIVGGLIMLFLSCTLEGGVGKIALFWNAPSVALVFGGAAAAILVAYPTKTILKAHRTILKTFVSKELDPLAAIMQITSLAETARREGLLSLENRMEEITDPFLAGGIRLAVDGMSPEVVEGIMSTEIEAVNGRHLYARSVLSNYGKYAPAFGMKGTLIGLVLMLANLDPDSVGPGMAVAILTTLYGAVVANLFMLPMADKLGFQNDSELQIMEITLKGVVAIQSGENPRVIRQKLLTYIAPADRPVEEEGAA